MYMKWIDTVPITETAQFKRLSTRGGKPRFFKTPTLEAFEEELKLKLRSGRPKEPIDEPVSALLIIVYPLLKGDTKTKKQREELKTRPLIPHATYPDADNAAKVILDVLSSKELGILENDNRIAKLRIEQYRGERTGVAIGLNPLTEHDLTVAKALLNGAIVLNG